MRKGQFAMEFIMVVAFSLLILIPVIALLYEEYDNNRTDVHIEHLNELARELVYQSERIYYQGPPSRTTVKAFIPPDVVDAQVYNDYIYFKIGSLGAPITQPSDVPLSGTLRTFSGPHTITLQVDDNDTPHDATDDFVLIQDE